MHPTMTDLRRYIKLCGDALDSGELTPAEYDRVFADLCRYETQLIALGEAGIVY